MGEKEKKRERKKGKAERKRGRGQEGGECMGCSERAFKSGCEEKEKRKGVKANELA